MDNENNNAKVELIAKLDKAVELATELLRQAKDIEAQLQDANKTI